MSYKLTIEFETREEVLAFLSSDSRPAVTTIAAETSEAPVKKPAAKRTATVKTEVADAPATPAASTPAPVNAGPVHTAPAAAPQSAPVSAPVAAPQAPVFDRAAALAKATALVGQLKATGLPDDQVMPNVHQVYAAAGCPVHLKIGQLDDAQLATFMPLFELKVASIVAQAKPAAAPASSSFI